MQILIGIANAAEASQLQQTLSKWGHTVTVAADGEEAWREYTAVRPSVVISDWSLPGMIGVELCRRVRTLSAQQYTYVMLLSAQKARTRRTAALQSGADGLLEKPIDMAELFARIDTARRILDMEDQIRKRTVDMAALHAEVEERNSELREAMSYMAHANDRFSELFEGLPTACYAWDSEGYVHQWNRAAANMTGYQADEVLTRRLWDVFAENRAQAQSATRRQHEKIIARVFSGEHVIGLETYICAKGGRRVHALSNILPIRSADGVITGGITASIDITDRVRLQSELANQLALAKRMNVTLAQQRQDLQRANKALGELAITDGLTGLKNHRYIREILEEAYACSAREGLPCSIIMLDVDRFKQFNDTFGHPAGDDVLRSVSSLLRSCARSYDVVARYGGEEFIVLCRSARKSVAIRLAERLRLAIEGYPWPVCPVTASFGAATFSLRTANASELLDEADRALYRSKHEGRNRVTHFEDINESIKQAVP